MNVIPKYLNFIRIILFLVLVDHYYIPPNQIKSWNMNFKIGNKCDPKILQFYKNNIILGSGQSLQF